jgi:hypothetical protein
MTIRRRARIGWREWVALPDLGVPRIKAKIDTGARSSALHAFAVERVKRRGKDLVRFAIHPIQRSSRREVVAEAEMIDERIVRSSNGVHALRPVIITHLELLGDAWQIELTLASRDEMGFRMLLGRQAMRGRFLIDPGRSYMAGKPGKVTTVVTPEVVLAPAPLTTVRATRRPL